MARSAASPRRTRDEPISLDVVGEIGGLHAQLMSSAELALWARVDKLKRNEVEKWLWTDRRLIKTWAMRGTLHLLQSNEYSLWQAGLSTYKHYLRPAWFKAFDVTGAELDKLIAAISKALDGRTLTREELAQRVAEITKSVALADKLRGSWGAMLKPGFVSGAALLRTEQRPQRDLCETGSVARAR